MTRLEICTKESADDGTVIENTGVNGKELAAQYDSCLEAASQARKEALTFRSVPLVDLPSANFQTIGILLKTIVPFQRTHEYPKTVRILCDKEETATLYRQVYNFWFAETKDARMEDEHWD